MSLLVITAERAFFDIERKRSGPRRLPPPPCLLHFAAQPADAQLPFLRWERAPSGRLRVEVVTASLGGGRLGNWGCGRSHGSFAGSNLLFSVFPRSILGGGSIFGPPASVRPFSTGAGLGLPGILGLS